MTSTNTKEVTSAQPREPKQNDQILFDRPNCLFVGRITTVTEKAVAVMYGLDPISAYSAPAQTVYTHECWIPKSVLIMDEHGISWTVKKWFARNFKGGRKMRYGTIICGEGKTHRV